MLQSYTTTSNIHIAFQLQRWERSHFFPLSRLSHQVQAATQLVVAALGVRQVYLHELYQLFGLYLIGSKPLLISYHKCTLYKEIRLSVLTLFCYLYGSYTT